jgi:hypothetical protein
MAQQVVARFQDGRVLKGATMDINPDKPFFHVRPAAGAAQVVALADLKAVFFVRSFDGDPAHDEDLTANPEDPRARGASLVRVLFADGEVVVGMTVRYPPNRPYFYVTPVDVKSNNVRMLVNGAATVSMELLSGMPTP